MFSGVPGNVVIYGNAPASAGGTCNSPEQVLATACESTVDVQHPGGPEVPGAFALSQNFPNPFNPTTAITFSLPEPARVRLNVFDMLGREVAVLASGDFAAGQFDVVWDASGISSGVYVYRLEADGFAETRKLTLGK